MMTSPTSRSWRQKSYRSKGFSLIELLIVVAIILIIAAIAIPNLLRARMSANEAAAVSNLRTITSASVVYSTTWGNGYAPTLATLGGSGTATCDQADLLDPILARAAINFLMLELALRLLRSPGVVHPAITNT